MKWNENTKAVALTVLIILVLIGLPFLLGSCMSAGNLEDKVGEDYIPYGVNTFVEHGARCWTYKIDRGTGISCISCAALPVGSCR